MDEQELCKKAMELGATGAGVISLAEVTPDPQFRDLCALNYCGRYQKKLDLPARLRFFGPVRRPPAGVC